MGLGRLIIRGKNAHRPQLFVPSSQVLLTTRPNKLQNKKGSLTPKRAMVSRVVSRMAALIALVVSQTVAVPVVSEAQTTVFSAPPTCTPPTPSLTIISPPTGPTTARQPPPRARFNFSNSHPTDNPSIIYLTESRTFLFDLTGIYIEAPSRYPECSSKGL